MNTMVLGVVIVTVSTGLAILGLLMVRKRVGLAKLVTYHEVAGEMLSVLGTLYAVLLGFVVVDAMNHLQEMRLNVEQEANSLANVFLAADGLPDHLKAKLHGYCDEYVKIVIDKEWDEMRVGQASDDGHIVSWKMWKLVTNFQCDSEGEGAIKDRLLEELSTMSDNRRTRLVMSSHGVHPIMWFFLITGAVFTMVFTYFFGLESATAQCIMTALIAITISLNVFLVYLFGYPFSGEVAVYPDAFKLDQKIFREYELRCNEPNALE